MAGRLLYVIMAANLPFDEPNLSMLFKKVACFARPDHARLGFVIVFAVLRSNGQLPM